MGRKWGWSMSEPVRVALTLAMLLAAGAWYNWLVARLLAAHPDQPYTAFLVAGGVLATLVGSAVLVGVEAALLVLMCFAASGLPMVIGSMGRALDDRRRERRAHIEGVLEQLEHID